MPFSLVDDVPLKTPSTKKEIVDWGTGVPVLSIRDTFTVMSSPRIVLSSGSRSEGTIMDVAVNPLLSKVAEPLLSVKYETAGRYVASTRWVPRGMSASSAILTVHDPLESTANEFNVNPSSEPSSSKFRLNESRLPERSVIVEPLPLSSDPVISKEPPAVGLELIGSTINCVSDLTVTLNVEADVGRRVVVPLKRNSISIRPRG